MSQKQVALYAGSFDPMTLGHLDIVKKVIPLFSELHIVVAHNSQKKTLFSPDERVSLIQQSLDQDSELRSASTDIKVCSWEGLVAEYCRKKDIYFLVRGLRAISDFDGEFQVATINRKLFSQLQTIHLMADEKFHFLSSSLVKELAQHKADLSFCVSPPVARALKEKYST